MTIKPDFNSSFTRAIYSWDENRGLEKGMRMWDIQNQKEIWSKGGWHGFTDLYAPEWARDGSKVALPAFISSEKNFPLEVFSVTSDGSEEQLADKFIYAWVSWTVP